MKLVVYFFLVKMFENNLIAAAPLDFDCYGDRCTLGVDYCDEGAGRCVPCSQNLDLCGAVKIHSACHLFCLNLTEQEPSTVDSSINVTEAPARPHATTCRKLTLHNAEQGEEPTLILLVTVFSVMLVINLCVFFGTITLQYLRNGPCKYQPSMLGL
ncbi:uncharacterized protein [Haliotis cracherodii]|uniref:uncharacterized protein isoform X2 n=1 Tax=Haliotis cracherodii TaxID=6455 RepID=UPI0039EABA41